MRPRRAARSCSSGARAWVSDPPVTRSCFAGALLLAGAAHARPAVDILAPTAGDCVNAGAGVVDVAPGGQPVVLPADVPLRLRFVEDTGAEIAVTVEVDGAVVLEAAYRPDAAGVAEETELFRVPAHLIEDGDGRRIRVVARVGAEVASDEVVIDLDRRPPDILLDEASQALLGQCFDGGPPDFEVVVLDAADPDPVVEERLVEEGCRVERVVTARDHCGAGNTARMVLPTYSLPLRPPVVTIQGILEGARVVTATVDFRVEAEPGCVTDVRATLSRNGGPAFPIGLGTVVEQPGDYLLEVQAEGCRVGAGDIRHFTVVDPPRADPGGPYRAVQGEALLLSAGRSEVPPELGGIAEYAWDLDNDGFFDPEEGREPEVAFDTTRGDGHYRVGLRITTNAGFRDFAYTDVIVADVDPICDAGGPYEIQQGLALRLDGSRSGAGHPSDPVVAWDWDFGDDRFPIRGLDPRPTHRYEDEGEFIVTLRLEDVDSTCEATARVTVTDIEPVIVNLRAHDADSLVEGEPVRFTAGQTSAGSAAEPLISFRWDFGDGNGAEGPELRGPVHVYEEGGEYTVCLEVSDIDSTIRQCFDIVVADLQPVARLSGPRFAVEGEEVVYDALGSRPGGADDMLTRYTWDFGDGTPPVVVDDPAETRVTHVFARDGRLTVTLTVHDEDSSASATLEVFVDDVRPNAALSGPATLFEGEEAVFDASDSRPGAPTDAITGYAWDFGDGTRVAGADRIQVAHTWADEGSYLVRLTVTDADGSAAAAEHYVSVRNRAPTEVTIHGEARPEIGVDVQYRVTYTDVPADVAVVSWRMGDGTVYENTTQVTHRYAATGYFTIRVTVDDRDGGVTAAAREILVTGAAPQIIAPERVDGVEGEPLGFRVEVASAPTDEGFDGPVSVEVPVRPQGLQWATLPGDDRARLQRLDFTWTPGLTDAGEHRVAVRVRSPAGIEHVREVAIAVADAGRAMLAAAHGGPEDGRVTVYAFEHDAARRRDTFSAVGEVAVGHGTGALVADAAGRRLYVAVPGSGAVAVIALDGGAARLMRLVPVPGAPHAVALGDERLWVIDANDGMLAGIDPATLKVVVRAGLGAERGISDAVWLDEHLYAVSPVTGALLAIDPADVARPVRARVSLGGRPHRILLDGDRLIVADAGSRRVLAVDPARLGEPEEMAALHFAPRDLALAPDGLWLVSDRGLERLQAGELSLGRRGAWRAVAGLPTPLFGLEAVTVGSPDRVAHLDADRYDELVGVRGGGAGRLLFFVTRP